MATVAENLAAFIKADSVLRDRLGERVFYGHVLEGTKGEYVYFDRQTTRHERALDDAQGERPFSETFNVECWSSRDVDAQTLADQLRTLDGYVGDFGDGSVQAIFFDEQDDDYVPAGAGGDDGIYLAALSVEVIPE